MNWQIALNGWQSKTVVSFDSSKEDSCLLDARLHLIDIAAVCNFELQQHHTHIDPH